jgi:small subunit ribosomal protein S9
VKLSDFVSSLKNADNGEEDAFKSAPLMAFFETRDRPKLLLAQVRHFLKGFIRPGSDKPKFALPKPSLDEIGRCTTYASRKTAQVQVHMLPGQGEIRVNSLPLSEYFSNPLERNEILKPLMPLEAMGDLDDRDGLGKWNIWAIVKGGGKSAQAQALSVAIARGRAVQQPSSEPFLKESTFPFAFL